ncbi:MAG: NfeD family protein [Methylophaga sp.]|nr:NfeD family protein [Methylophaga sp.]
MEFALTFWHWWIFAAALITFEVLLPTFYLLWTGIAAFIVGLIVWLVPSLAWEIQVVIFAVLSVLSIVMWRNYAQKNPVVSDEPLLNRRGEQYVGRVVTLKEPIVDGHGKVKLDDSTWKINGADCDAGTQIKIMSVNNVVFQVEKVS